MKTRSDNRLSRAPLFPQGPLNSKQFPSREIRSSLVEDGSIHILPYESQVTGFSNQGLSSLQS